MKVNLFVFVFALNVDFQFCSTNVLTDSKNELQNKYFQISQDQIKVEEMVIVYAKSRKNSNNIRTKIRSVVRLLWNTNICHQSKEVKIAFCAELLQIDYYGFEFDVKKSTNFYCESRSFEVKSTVMTEADNFQLPMFQCPDIVYTDLETNKKVYWLYQYHISEARKHDSAFIFFQKSLHPTIYPQKYAYNISFKSLKDRFQQNNDDLDQPSNRYFRGSPMKEKIVEYLVAKKICNPYRKFVKLLFSINICSLQRSYKIYICQEAMKTSVAKLKVNMEDYDEERCKKHKLKLHYSVKENLQQNNKLFTLHCLLYKLEKINAIEYSHLYITSSIDRGFVTIYSRRNELRELLSPVMNKNLRNIMLLLMKDIRRTKLMPYSKSRKQIEKKLTYNESINEMKKKLNAKMNNAKILLQSLPIRELKFATPSFQLILKSKLLDDVLILFSKIKSSKLVYQKFQNLYKSLNICQMSISQIYNLCKSILEALKTQLDGPVFVSTNPSPCVRIKIILNLREVENLESNIFAIRQCSTSFNFATENFYLSQIHEKDSVTLLISSKFFRDLYKIGIRNQQPKFFPYAILIKI